MVPRTRSAPADDGGASGDGAYCGDCDAVLNRDEAHPPYRRCIPSWSSIRSMSLKYERFERPALEWLQVFVLSPASTPTAA
jgi:hypothetical protein